MSSRANGKPITSGKPPWRENRRLHRSRMLDSTARFTITARWHSLNRPTTSVARPSSRSPRNLRLALIGASSRLRPLPTWLPPPICNVSRHRVPSTCRQGRRVLAPGQGCSAQPDERSLTRGQVPSRLRQDDGTRGHHRSPRSGSRAAPWSPKAPQRIKHAAGAGRRRGRCRPQVASRSRRAATVAPRQRRLDNQETNSAEQRRAAVPCHGRRFTSPTA